MSGAFSWAQRASVQAPLLTRLALGEPGGGSHARSRILYCVLTILDQSFCRSLAMPTAFITTFS